mmetsp:Transcript_42439/g.133049  ORF Transcript_42439/g.133049 Transcript_42439/m.133049 type:complete len:496 (+) Transcript_42439:227-1714(+)
MRGGSAVLDHGTMSSARHVGFAPDKGADDEMIVTESPRRPRQLSYGLSSGDDSAGDSSPLKRHTHGSTYNASFAPQPLARRNSKLGPMRPRAKNRRRRSRTAATKKREKLNLDAAMMDHFHEEGETLEQAAERLHIFIDPDDVSSPLPPPMVSPLTPSRQPLSPGPAFALGDLAERHSGADSAGVLASPASGVSESTKVSRRNSHHGVTFLEVFRQGASVFGKTSLGTDMRRMEADEVEHIHELETRQAQRKKAGLDKQYVADVFDSLGVRNRVVQLNKFDSDDVLVVGVFAATVLSGVTIMESERAITYNMVRKLLTGGMMCVRHVLHPKEYTKPNPRCIRRRQVVKLEEDFDLRFYDLDDNNDLVGIRDVVSLAQGEYVIAGAGTLCYYYSLSDTNGNFSRRSIVQQSKRCISIVTRTETVDIEFVPVSNEDGIIRDSEFSACVHLTFAIAAFLRREIQIQRARKRGPTPQRMEPEEMVKFLSDPCQEILGFK